MMLRQECIIVSTLISEWGRVKIDADSSLYLGHISHLQLCLRQRILHNNYFSHWKGQLRHKYQTRFLCTRKTLLRIMHLLAIIKRLWRTALNFSAYKYEISYL